MSPSLFKLELIVLSWAIYFALCTVLQLSVFTPLIALKLVKYIQKGITFSTVLERTRIFYAVLAWLWLGGQAV